MRIAYTSDLHADITLNNKNLVPYLAKRIEEMNPDVFIIAGDVANTLYELNSALSAFDNLSCVKVMIPGNHHVWIESKNSVKKGKDSFYKYTQGIPQICKENNFLYPVNAPIIMGNTAIVGGMVVVQNFYKVKDHRICTGISSYNPHKLVYKLNLKRDRLNFFNLSLSKRVRKILCN